MKKTIYSICMVIFEITLPLFLIMGAVLVYTQLFGAIIGDGKLVKTINSSLKTYSVWARRRKKARRKRKRNNGNPASGQYTTGGREPSCCLSMLPFRHKNIAGWLIVIFLFKFTIY